jgi:hypothetical protein
LRFVSLIFSSTCISALGVGDIHVYVSGPTCGRRRLPRLGEHSGAAPSPLVGDSDNNNLEEVSAPLCVTDLPETS